MTEQRIRYLFERYFTNSCTESEQLEFLQLIHEGRQDDTLLEVLQDCWNVYAPDRPMPEDAGERVLEKIMRPRGAGKAFPFQRRMRWIAGVAALFLLVMISGYLLRGYLPGGNKIGTHPLARTVVHDVAPGGNRAILTLANGKTIVLDSAAIGKLAQQGNVKVIKMQDGKLGFEGVGVTKEEVLYNTVSTPYGGKYQVVLTDGTKVWLNAASSLVFPTAFKGATREVSLKGEGYFEVAPNASQPFVVNVGDMKVDVLGTSFNINAYEDEGAVRTTLVEGAVRIGGGGASKTLGVGEQNVWDRKDRMEVIHDADVETAVAWKNGLIQFHSADMPVIMRQLARWYNVQVVYASEDIKDESFSGSIPSTEHISEVLKMLELTGTVHFDVTGQSIMVRR
ncbi:MAG TPA: FecR domain-containing protein [Puia sp.]|jgi:ferric-dicitrate binding protein FerR (iron transport regulator)